MTRAEKEEGLNQLAAQRYKTIAHPEKPPRI
jgi:hypothetical protein